MEDALGYSAHHASCMASGETGEECGERLARRSTCVVKEEHWNRILRMTLTRRSLALAFMNLTCSSMTLKVRLLFTGRLNAFNPGMPVQEASYTERSHLQKHIVRLDIDTGNQ